MNRLIFAAALLASSPAMAACPTYSTIVDVGTVALQPNTLVTVPPTGGASGSGFSVVKLTVGLPTAIKEATGHTLYVEADVSQDGGTTWAFNSSINWTSYGHSITVNVGGDCVVTDPDPTLAIPLNGKANAIYRLQYQTDLTSGHPVFSGK